jgi:glycosyltransferase involved in cell wall biosynthesis
MKGLEARGHKVYYYDYASSFPFVEENGSPFDPYFTVEDDNDLFDQARKHGVDVMNVHYSIGVRPPDDIPTVRTVHDHIPHCPSWKRFLGRWKKPCPRRYNLMGCLWGHIVDGCGNSRRPDRWINEFKETWNDQEVLPHIRCVAVSNFVKEQMVRSGYPGDRITVIHLPAPTSDAYSWDVPDEEVPRLLYIGRIEPEKGVDWLLRTVSRIDRPIRLDIAGDGHKLEEMKRLVERLGLSQRVSFHGWVDQEQVSKLIRSSLAVIFPSLCHDAAGNVTLEAGAFGRAVIASRVGGIPEYAIHNQNALLVEPNNLSELRSKILKVITDPTLARQLGESGYRMVNEKFTLDRHLDGLIKVYEQEICD